MVGWLVGRLVDLLVGLMLVGRIDGWMDRFMVGCLNMIFQDFYIHMYTILLKNINSMFINIRRCFKTQ